MLELFMYNLYHRSFNGVYLVASGREHKRDHFDHKTALAFLQKPHRS